MKVFSEAVQKRIIGIGYILIIRESNEGTKYIIECTLNAEACLIAVGTPNCINMWAPLPWINIATKKAMKERKYQTYLFFPTFEELIEAYPILYDKYFITQPPVDPTQGKYTYRDLTHFESYMRKGWSKEEYEEHFDYYSEERRNKSHGGDQ